MTKITTYRMTDVRFPTSLTLDGSDAMNPEPDYSAAYIALETDADDGLEGHGFVFTIGRGNEVELAAIRAVMMVIENHELDGLLADMGATWKLLVHDSQLRWLGPETGVIHMAIGAVVNALWDLKCKRAGLPLWQLLSRMPPEELVSLVDFRYLTEALTPDEALNILQASSSGRGQREAELIESGYPAYTTTPGWLGYSDEKLERLCRQALDDGFSQIKLKVGANLEDDLRRMAIARRVCGPGYPIAIDANQNWDVPDAIAWIRELAQFDIRWVEEPTSPVDVIGHAAIAKAISPIPVATGEHAQSRVIFKQLMQSQAIGFAQIDAARVAGVNENIAILLLAAKFGIPVCPHAGGVGLCEAVQHLAMFDFVAVSGSREGRMIEYVDHLHEHFVTPVVLKQGNYLAPLTPGAGTEMLTDSIARYTWRGHHVLESGA